MSHLLFAGEPLPQGPSLHGEGPRGVPPRDRGRGDHKRVTWRVAGGRAVPGPPRRQPAFSDRGDWRPGCRPAHLRTVTTSTGLRGCGQAGAARPGRATQEPGRRRLRLSTAPGWVPLSTCAWPPAPAIAGGLHRCVSGLGSPAGRQVNRL